jgi:hypothetical protein
MDTFSKDIVKKIEKQHITPRSRWIFAARDIGTWVLSGILLIIGAMVISAAWYSLFDHDWDVYAYVGANPLVSFLENVPYFWIAIALVLFGLVFLTFRKTREGYHYAAGAIVVGAIVIGLVAGAMLFGIGAGEHVERLASTYVPYYQSAQERQAELWMNPDHGLLAGTINQIDSTTQFVLTDLEGKQWTITASGTRWRSGAHPFQGSAIKLIGSVVTGTTMFIAKEIRPWFSVWERQRPLY